MPAIRRFAALAPMLGYGFVAGLPLPLSGFTFRQWLTEGGASLAIIGLTANISLPYTLKILWAPLFDHARAPLGLARLGRRRGWLLLVQPALAAACLLLAGSDPIGRPAAALAAAGLVAFLSASQDILIDAWRIETYPQVDQGGALAAYVWGYRAALLLAGAGAIYAASRLGWHVALAGVAALVALGPLLTLVVAEPAVAASVRAVAGWAARLSDTVWAPLRDFFARPGAATILAFVALFKLGEAMAGIMTTPLYRHLGFSPAEVAATGLYSLGASIAGYAFGGVLVARFGAARALLGTGLVQTAAMGLYLVLVQSPGRLDLLYLTVMAEAFAQGTADAAFLTYLSSLCTVTFTATQYALLSSLAALGLHTVGGLSGKLAAALGWAGFYTLALFAACPAMLLMVRLLRRFPAPEPARI